MVFLLEKYAWGSVVTLTVDGLDCSASSLVCFTSGRKPSRLSLNKMLCVSQSRCKYFGEETNFFRLPGFDLRTVQPAANVQ